jgi:hypothetical protein
MTDEITLDRLVTVERKITAALEEKQKELDDLEAQREEVRATILAIMNERNEESVRTANGTVTRSVSTRYWATDWSAFHQYVLDHGALDLIERRVAQRNMKEWIEAHPNDFPPSLNIDRKYTITIRKPRKGASNE